MDDRATADDGRKRRLLHRCRLPAVGLIILLSVTCAHASCPKLIMFDGVDILTQTNVSQAQYWGRRVGVQGFFLNHVMPFWQADVGLDPQSDLWQLARRFQRLYGGVGVTANFIKVALYKRHDWHDAKENARIADNFAHAAALAKYAQFSGVAIDVEPYVPNWGGEAGGEELAPTVYGVGRAIGLAMHRAYPEMTLFIIGDALHWARRHEDYHGGYGLALPFLRGLFSGGFSRVVIGTELTYNDPAVISVTNEELGKYREFLKASHLRPENISVAPGIWPLGRSYEDKSPRMSPLQFETELRAAFSVAPDYVWIYGYGSAWQSDGPYGDGGVTKGFDQYLAALNRAEASCTGP